MKNDVVQNQNEALVVRQNQFNSIADSSQNSSLNDLTESLNNSSTCNASDIASQFSSSVSGGKLTDSHKQYAAANDRGEIVNELIDGKEEKYNSTDQDNSGLDNADENTVETNERSELKLDCSPNQHNHINEQNETIHKLGLSLDYHPQSNLAELEKSISSSASTVVNEFESSSIVSTNSGTNSPDSTLQNALQFAPKLFKRNTSETNLLFSDIEPKNREEQAGFFEIERKNLMLLSSLILNKLTKTISPLTKNLECHDNIVPYDFFSIIELICKHGLKARKGLIFLKKDVWNLLENVENKCNHITEIMQNIKELPNVKTNNGKVKAFLRLVFVHKVFNETFIYLTGCRELLRNYYEDEAFILSNEMNELLLKTNELKDFDFRWCAKDDKLDELSNLIDLTNYLEDQERTSKEIIYKVNVNQHQIKELIEEKQFYENKSKEFRDRILFYYRRIKELDIESLFEGDLIKSPSKIELLAKKLNEFFKSSLTVTENKDEKLKLLSLQEDIATLKKALEIELSNRISKDAALEYIESDLLIKQDENIVMRHQIEEAKLVNEELCAKVGELGQLNTQLRNKTLAFSIKNQQLISNVAELQRALVASEAKYNQLSKERSLHKEFAELKKLNEFLKAQLVQEQVEKDKLQKRLDENMVCNSKSCTELSLATNCANDYQSLKKKHDVLQRKIYEYEQTMEEIGTQLQAAKLEIENLKEENRLSNCVWKDDSNVDLCEGCSALFTTINRRHHCRSCGGIFCQKCSDRKIPLPANSKPCRVCDDCHVKLLQRYNG